MEKKKLEKKEDDAWSRAPLGVAGGGGDLVASVGVPKSEVDLLLAKQKAESIAEQLASQVADLRARESTHVPLALLRAMGVIGQVTRAQFSAFSVAEVQDWLKTNNCLNLPAFALALVDGFTLLGMTASDLESAPFLLPAFKSRALLNKLAMLH